MIPYKSYTVHNDTEIKGFFEDYRFLSNFHPCEVWYEYTKYPSSENAYQAAKVTPYERIKFANCTPNTSKRLWKECTLLDVNAQAWNKRKYDVMKRICYDKFLRNVDLRNKLLETGDRYLEETNSWKDIYWGVDINLGGKNNLGKLLMEIRSYWNNINKLNNLTK